MAEDRRVTSRLLAVGFGYCAAALAERLKAKGWAITGTGRSGAALEGIAAQGHAPVLFAGEDRSRALAQAIGEATHLLVSAPPGAEGDPLLIHHGEDLARAEALRWTGYLSTAGVYGDYGGAWVHETTPPAPISGRSQRRLDAENAWRAFAQTAGRDVQIFRLAGIYGPRRNALERLKAGQERRIFKPEQVFNRIHVADIANVLEAAIELCASGKPGPQRGAIFNVTDDEPAPPQDVIAFAAGLLGLEAPPLIPLAQAELSPMARSFYAENKRVSNARIKRELGVKLSYPTYREGLEALHGDPQA